jgi:5-methylcytosine-specific restriction endonuclease McrA
LSASDSTSKTCLRCKRDLPLAAFSRHKSRPDGLQAYCKECYLAANRVIRARHVARETIAVPETKLCPYCGVVKAAAEFYKDKGQPTGLYVNCKVCHRALTDAWKATHPEAVKRTARASYGRNRVKRIQEAKDYWYTNHERCKARARAYKLANRTQATALQRNRDARKTGNGGTHTAEDIQAQYERQGGKCFYCHQKLDKYHVDHAIPLVLGGSNGPENLVVACPECNMEKGAKHPMDFCGRLL